MKAQDVEAAVIAARREEEGFFSLDPDLILRQALPILRRMAERSKGWKFWLRWGINALIGAVEAYLRLRGFDL